MEIIMVFEQTMNEGDLSPIGLNPQLALVPLPGWQNEDLPLNSLPFLFLSDEDSEDDEDLDDDESFDDMDDDFDDDFDDDDYDDDDDDYDDDDDDYDYEEDVDYDDFDE